MFAVGTGERSSGPTRLPPKAPGGPRVNDRGHSGYRLSAAVSATFGRVQPRRDRRVRVPSRTGSTPSGPLAQGIQINAVANRRPLARSFGSYFRERQDERHDHIVGYVLPIANQQVSATHGRS